MRSKAFAVFNAALTVAPPHSGAVTVKRNKKTFRNLLLIPLLLFTVLCMFAGNTSANGELIWPVEADLLYNDGDIAQLWHDGGDVSIWNTKN